jgi:hypothetical protein
MPPFCISWKYYRTLLHINWQEITWTSITRATYCVITMHYKIHFNTCNYPLMNKLKVANFCNANFQLYTQLKHVFFSPGMYIIKFTVFSTDLESQKPYLLPNANLNTDLQNCITLGQVFNSRPRALVTETLGRHRQFLKCEFSTPQSIYNSTLCLRPQNTYKIGNWNQMA